MARTGPKPKSAAVKRQRGSSGRRIAEDALPEVHAQGGAATGVPAPDWLKDEALKVWDRLTPTLVAAKLVTAADAVAFARYCRNLARWLKMQTALDTGETYSVTTASGTVHRAKPEFVIADRLERMLLASEDRFGLNPAERQRIMAARSASGVSGDLFASAPREGDPAAQPAPAAKPVEGPLGLLN